jgi:hypothetical protein
MLKALKNQETNAMFFVSQDEAQKMLSQYPNILVNATAQDLVDGGCSDQIFKDCGLDKPVVDVEVTDKPNFNKGK